MMQRFPCELPEAVKQNVLNLGVSKRALIDSVPFQSKSESVLAENPLVDLCFDACTNAMDQEGIPPSKIGYFIATYDANPILSPGLSQLLVRKIGLNAYAKNVNAQGMASTAFPKALLLAEDHLARHPRDNVLICVSGVSSYWFQNQVRGIKSVSEMRRISEIRNDAEKQQEIRKWTAAMEYFLFGDGVVAIIVSNQNGGVMVRKTVEVTNVLERDCLAGYSRLSSLPTPFTFGLHSYLDKDIPTLGVKYTDLALKRLLGKNVRETIRRSRKWAVHTGSQKILNALAEHHGVDADKFKESHDVLRDHGNLSGASLPFILDRIIRTSKLTKNDAIMMLGYGWGFSAAASLLQV